MITGQILSFLAAIATAVVGVLPPIPVPTWLSGSGSAFSTMFADAASMGVWFPFTLVSTVLAAYLGIKLLGFGIKVARMVLSVLTGGGGSAA